MFQALHFLPPSLHSFDSLAIGPLDVRMTSRQLYALCSFLKGRPQLRRFATRRTLTAGDADLLFKALATLDVLALHLECSELPTKEWLHRLLDHIPAGLTAI